MGEFPHHDFDVNMQGYELKKQDALPLYNATVARKRAEQDGILLANRIRLLRAEEEKTRKKIAETETRTAEVLDLRRRQEERRLAKEAEEARRAQEEEQLRLRQQREREERERKLNEGQRSVQEQRAGISNAVRHERKVHLLELEEQRAIDAAEMKARADSVRASTEAAARSRARSEGAKQEAAKSIVRERVMREEEARQNKVSEIEKMEREEAQLIARLQYSQERHKAAFMQLEDALKDKGPPPQLGNGLLSGRGSACGTPIAAQQSVPSVTAVERSRHAAALAGAGGGSYRPPRPRQPAITAAVPRVSSNARHDTRPDSSRVSSARLAPSKTALCSAPTKGALCNTPSKDGGRVMSSTCSTASGGESGPGAASSGPSTPSSAAPPPITYTTVDGGQIDIPVEEELDLDSLLNAC